MRDRTWATVWVATAAVVSSTGCGARTELDEARWNLDALDEPGVVGSPMDRPADPEEEQVEEPVVEPPLLAPIGECDLEPIWWQPEPIRKLTPTTFSVNPDESLLMVSNAYDNVEAGMLRLGNGDVLNAPHFTHDVWGVDASWDRALVRTTLGSEQRVQVVNGDRTQTLFEHEIGPEWVYAVLNEEGTYVGMLECSRGNSTQAPTLTIWSLDDTHAPVATATLPDDQCRGTFPPSSHFTISRDGSSVAYVSIPETFAEDPKPTRVFRLDASDGVRGGVDLPMGDVELDFSEYHGVVASLSYTPAGNLSVVSAYGKRTIFDDDLQIVSQEDRGAFVSNQDTFLPPLPMSPIAWTTDGNVEASVALDGAVELRLLDGSIAARLFAPEASDLAEWGETSGVENAPVGVTFSPDDAMIAVAFRKGIGLWGCPDALPTPRVLDREIRLDAPASATLGESVPLEVVVTGAPTDWLVYRLFVDGELRQSWLDPSQLRYFPYEAGRHDLELEVDDGWGPTRSATEVVLVAGR